MRKNQTEKMKIKSDIDVTIEPAQAKQWKAPLLSKLDLKCTYGRQGLHTDSDGSPSDKS